MNEIRNATAFTLEADPAIMAMVGLDFDGSPKIYEREAKKDVVAPFVVWQLVPGPEPTGHYGDLHAMEERDVQITAWGRNDNEAWQLYQLIREAMEDPDVSVELIPYTKLTVKRMGDERALDEPEVRWVQIPSTYRISLAR